MVGQEGRLDTDLPKDPKAQQIEMTCMVNPKREFYRPRRSGDSLHEKEEERLLGS